MSDLANQISQWRGDSDEFAEFLAALGEKLRAHDRQGLLPFVDLARAAMQMGSKSVAMSLSVLLMSELLDRPLDVDAFQPEGTFADLSVDLLQNIAADDELAPSVVALNADIYRTDGQIVEATELYRVALEMFREVGDRGSEAETLMSMSALALQAGEMAHAAQLSESAVEAFESVGQTERAAYAVLSVARARQASDGQDSPEAMLQALMSTPVVRSSSPLRAEVRRNYGVALAESGQWKAARVEFDRALRSCRERGDSVGELYVTQNIATMYSRSRRTGLALRWWNRTERLAEQIGDATTQRDAASAMAGEFVGIGDFAAAGAQLERSRSLSELIDDRPAVLHAKADLAATHLSRAQELARKRQGRRADNDHSFVAMNELLESAESELIAVLEELEKAEDFDWALTAINNLRVTWVAQAATDRGIDYIEAKLRHAGAFPTAYISAIRSSLGFLGAASSRAADWVASNIIEGATGADLTLEEMANELAGAAQTVEFTNGAVEAAELLWKAALAPARGTNDNVLLGDLLNDYGLFLANDEDWDRAEATFGEAADLGVNTSNRALAALALGNLGEMRVRAGRLQEAIDALSQSVKFYEALGDRESAADYWSTLSGVYLRQSNPAAALKAAETAREFVAADTSTPTQARVLSCFASLAFAEERYEAAFDGWEAAQRRAPTRSRPEYWAFALDSLAMLGDSRRFSSLLDRYMTYAQKLDLQVEFADELPLVALTWMQRGKWKPAAKVLAYAVLLAVDQYSATKPWMALGAAPMPSRQALVNRAFTIFATANVYLESDVVAAADRDKLRHHFDACLRRLAGDEAAETITSAIADVTKRIAEQ